MFGIAAFVVTAATWLDYLRRIPAERVPRRPVWHGIAQGIAIVASLVGMLRGEYVLPIFSVALAGYFLWLLTQATMPEGTLTVGVGDPMPVITARTASGGAFSSAERVGTRTLYKFFRGHW